MKSTFCLWVTGLPGSGKSSIAGAASAKLKLSGIDNYVLHLDMLRKIITPDPDYSEREREFAYRALAGCAKVLYENNINVIIDATANRRIYREFARNIMDNFYEIFIKCPPEVCAKRESERKDHPAGAQLYKKAKQAKEKSKDKKTDLMPGVDVPYEHGNPELVVDSEKMGIEKCAEKIAGFVLAMR